MRPSASAPPAAMLASSSFTDCHRLLVERFIVERSKRYLDRREYRLVRRIRYTSLRYTVVGCKGVPVCKWTIGSCAPSTIRPVRLRGAQWPDMNSPSRDRDTGQGQCTSTGSPNSADS